MALVLTLPNALTDPGSLPKHYLDDIIAAGTLMLWEPGSPINPVAAAPVAPTLNSGRAAITLMPNLAASAVAPLVNATPFDVTGTITGGNLLTVTVAGSKNINVGDKVGSGSTYVCGFSSGAGGTGTYLLTSGATNVGSSTITITPTTDLVFSRSDGAGSASNLDAIVELSTKKGVHVITSQSTMATFRIIAAYLPGPIKKYIFDNPSHEYAWSAWYKVTRVDATNTGPYAALKKVTGTSAGILNIQRGGPTGMTVSSAVPVGARNTLGLVHERVSNNYDSTALTNDASDFIAALFGFGSIDASYGDHGRNKSMSAVLYRLVFEDLTASGRSFAQFGAIDDAQRAIAFASGGRYDGDSYTAVSTLA